jgi:hypothetical protein
MVHVGTAALGCPSSEARLFSFPDSVSSDCSLSQTGMNIEAFGDLTQPLISSPQKNGRVEKNRSNQVRINQTNPKFVQPPRLNRVPHLAHLRHSHLR